MVIVRGYLGDRIAGPTGAGPALRFVDNPDWANNNILTSLLYAEAEMRDGFLFSYSDIVFSREHARRVAAAHAPVALIVDRRWRDAYQGRTLHPVSEAELARVAGSGDGAVVTRVGKRLVAAEEAAGEFTGLARFAPEGAAALRAVWADALARGPGQPVRRRGDAAAGVPVRRSQRDRGARRAAARGARRRRLARDRHRAGSRERRAGRRRLAVVTCRAAIPATGSTASTRPNGSPPRRPSSPTRRRSCPAARSAPA